MTNSKKKSVNIKAPVAEASAEAINPKIRAYIKAYAKISWPIYVPVLLCVFLSGGIASDYLITVFGWSNRGYIYAANGLLNVISVVGSYYSIKYFFGRVKE